MPDPWAFGWDQIAAFANTAAIVFAAWIAKRSVREWRQERLKARQSEVAEQALSLAYQAPEVFDRIRRPFGYANEGSSRKPEADETPEEKQERDSDFVPIERVVNEARFFEQVVDIRPCIDALFGKGSAEPFTEFLKIRTAIISAARMLSRLNRRTHFHTQQQRDNHFEKNEKYEKLIHSRSDEDDIKKRVEGAVSSIENLAAPLLKSRLRPQKSA